MDNTHTYHETQLIAGWRPASFGYPVALQLYPQEQAYNTPRQLLKKLPGQRGAVISF